MNATCPSCSVDLVPDGDAQVCPRCSRLFSVALVKAASSDLYRDADIVDIVPARRKPPRWRGLTVKRDDERLEVRLKAMRRPLASIGKGALAGGIGLTLALAVMSAPTFIILFLIAMLFAVTSPTLFRSGLKWFFGRQRVREETIVIDDAGLHLTQVDRAGHSSSRDCDLATLRGVRDDAPLVRLHFNDDSSVAIGTQVVMPQKVRRWLIQSIASRLPENP